MPVTLAVMKLLHARLLGTAAKAGAIVPGPRTGNIGQLTYLRAT